MDTLIAVVTPGATIIATALFGWLVTEAIAFLQAHTKLQFTAQQRALLLTGADNAAGTLVTMLLAKKVLPVELTSPTAKPVADLATAVINRMPGPAAAIGVTPAQMAQVIVGRVGQLLAQPAVALAAQPTVAKVV